MFIRVGFYNNEAWFLGGFFCKVRAIQLICHISSTPPMLFQVIYK
jgi:hypothetical protein